MSPITRNKKRKFACEFDTTYYSPSALKNYILNDPILDFLKKKYGHLRHDSNLSLENILEAGYQFEADIIASLYKKNKFNIYNIHKSYRENKLDHYEHTKNLIQEGKYNIILNGMLINDTNKTYGYPDMIVKGKWIMSQYPNINIYLHDEQYYIIDIKSSTINLINNGTEVGNKQLYKMYKSQIYIYMKALEQIQGTSIHYGFILGKCYTHIHDKKVIKNHNPFDNIGIINYNDELIDYDDIIEEAIEWKHEVDKNWYVWDENNISHPNLFPNMKNKYDYPYKKLKKEIALQNKEITLLWKCGLKHRKKAFENNVYRYDDPKLNCDLLGIHKNSANILDKIIHINRSTNYIDIPKENNVMNWRNKHYSELFVDFETYLDNHKTILYMIGVGYYSDKWNFKCFYINDNNCQTEKMLIEQFIEFIKTFHTERLIHWSNAEKTIMDKKLKEHNINYVFPWYDLLKVFKCNKNPIVVKDAYNFSLKEITKALNKHKLVDIKWSDIDDGLLSAQMAKDIYNNKLEWAENMDNIVHYNQIDCKAMYELLTLIRCY